MLGAIIGDIVGSVYEFANIKNKEFEFFSPNGSYTDDTILTVATADWLLHGGDVAHYYSRYGNEHPCPMGGYGGMFGNWLVRSAREGDFAPYDSCGNGSAMRVSPVGWAFDTLDDVRDWAERSAACTHNHPEGIKGAQATAVAILLARQGADKETIRTEIERAFGYNLHFTCDECRPDYGWGATCQDSVPQAIVAFLDGTDFEDCVRNAISLGGDSDTIGCITGSIAQAAYGIPNDLRAKALTYLPDDLKGVLLAFEDKFMITH